MDRAVLETRTHGGAHHPVLVDPAHTLELRGADNCAEVVAATLVANLDLSAGKGGADHLLELSQIGGHPLNLLRAIGVACRLDHLLDGRELHPWPAEGLAANNLGPIDRLPAAERDEVGHAV